MCSVEYTLLHQYLYIYSLRLLTPSIHYLHMFHSVPIYGSLHSVPVYYMHIYPLQALCILSTCINKYIYIYYINICTVIIRIYTDYKLDINHLQLHKHCQCRTVVVGNPQATAGGGNHLAGGGGGCGDPCSYIT